jgi:hypothetical protein
MIFFRRQLRDATNNVFRVFHGHADAHGQVLADVGGKFGKVAEAHEGGAVGEEGVFDVGIQVSHDICF